MSAKILNFFMTSYLILVSADVAYGQSGPVPIADVVPERVDPDVTVSGSTVAGVHFGSATTPATDTHPSLKAYVLSLPDNNVICMRARSIDGTYLWVRQDQMVTPWDTADLQEFSYNSSEPDSVIGTSHENFAIALTVGECENEPDTFLIAQWNAKGDLAQANVHVLINSLNASAVELYPSKGAQEPVICSPTRAAKPATFDKVCTFPADQLDRGISEVEVSIFRSGVQDEPLVFKIARP